MPEPRNPLPRKGPSYQVFGSRRQYRSAVPRNPPQPKSSLPGTSANAGVMPAAPAAIPASAPPSTVLRVMSIPTSLSKAISARQAPRRCGAEGGNVARRAVRAPTARGDDGGAAASQPDRDPPGPGRAPRQPPAVLVPDVDVAGDAVLQHQRLAGFTVHTDELRRAVAAGGVHEERAFRAQARD